MPVSAHALALLDTFIRTEALDVGPEPIARSLQTAIDRLDHTDAPPGTPPGLLQQLDIYEVTFYGSAETPGIIDELYTEAAR
jgi:hypothetical protein